MALKGQRRFINLSNVTSGMMVQFSYKKLSGGSDQYVVLVVDPNRQNQRATEPQLHGFIIDELSDSELIEFFSSFGTTTKLDIEQNRAPVVEALNTDEAYAKFASSKYVKNRSYRTFNLSGISQVRQILLGEVK